MLNDFRSLAHSLLAKLLMGLLILTFAVWGIGDVVRHGGRNADIATVGSSGISTAEFARALRQETENMRRLLGNNDSPEAIRSLNIPPHLLQNMINRRLLLLESQSLGIVPADGEIARLIRGISAFQNNQGKFDRSLFEAFLRNTGQSEQHYVEQLRQDIAVKLLADTLTSGISVPAASVQALYAAYEEQRSLALYILSPLMVSGIPQPTDAQIDAYYHEHSRNFIIPEYRNLTYATLAESDIHPAAPSEEAMEKAYKERIDEFRRPERRTVEQLLYASEDAAKKAEALLQSGKTFEQVAKETDIVNKNSVSLGKIQRNGVPENTANAVFSLPSGGHTPPIQSAFGWHIFHVSAIEPAAVMPFEEAWPAIEKDLNQRAAEEARSQLANKIEDALAGGATLQEAAKELGLKLHTFGPVDHEGKSPQGDKVKEVPAFDKFLDIAFRTDEKSESGLIPSKGGVYYIVRVDSVTPARIRPLQEVRSEVVSEWQKQERIQRLGAVAKDIAAAFANPGKREGAIAQYRLTPLSVAVKRSSTTADNIALPPQLVADVFAHKPQESTGAWPLQNGDYAIAVITGTIPAPAPESDFKKKEELADIRSHLEI
ncbi:MAG: SurA N-terminal domain-containing protein, partial [Pseudomonadota bacterium]|nr:SurA N-terminal domain-containing protein [Pseudomonadota bacterium]